MVMVVGRGERKRLVNPHSGTQSYKCTGYIDLVKDRILYFPIDRYSL